MAIATTRNRPASKPCFAAPGLTSRAKHDDDFAHRAIFDAYSEEFAPPVALLAFHGSRLTLYDAH
jgi:hypothetical protein